MPINGHKIALFNVQGRLILQLLFYHEWKKQNYRKYLILLGLDSFYWPKWTYVPVKGALQKKRNVLSKIFLIFHLLHGNVNGGDPAENVNQNVKMDSIWEKRIR